MCRVHIICRADVSGCLSFIQQFIRRAGSVTCCEDLSVLPSGSIGVGRRATLSNALIEFLRVRGSFVALSPVRLRGGPGVRPVNLGGAVIRTQKQGLELSAIESAPATPRSFPRRGLRGASHSMAHSQAMLRDVDGSEAPKVIKSTVLV